MIVNQPMEVNCLMGTVSKDIEDSEKGWLIRLFSKMQHIDRDGELHLDRDGERLYRVAAGMSIVHPWPWGLKTGLS